MTYIDVDIFRLMREGREGKFLTRVDHGVFNKRCTISTPPASGDKEQMYLWDIRCAYGKGSMGSL